MLNADTAFHTAVLPQVRGKNCRQLSQALHERYFHKIYWMENMEFAPCGHHDLLNHYVAYVGIYYVLIADVTYSTGSEKL